MDIKKDERIDKILRDAVEEIKVIPNLTTDIGEICIIVKGSGIGFAIPRENGQDPLSNLPEDEMKEIADALIKAVMPLIVIVNEEYKNLPEPVSFKVGDYMEPAITKDRIIEILNRDKLSFLIDRIENDKEFCMEILLEMYPEESRDAEINQLLNYFN